LDAESKNISFLEVECNVGSLGQAGVGAGVLTIEYKVPNIQNELMMEICCAAWETTVNPSWYS
jgi:hypothetical protein